MARALPLGVRSMLKDLGAPVTAKKTVTLEEAYELMGIDHFDANPEIVDYLPGTDPDCVVAAYDECLSEFNESDIKRICQEILRERG